MSMVTICREMGWDYHIYQSQPRWFIELIKAQLEIDSDKAQKINSKLSKHGRKKR
jgi:hypothetical protein